MPIFPTDDSWRRQVAHDDQFVGTRIVRVLDGSGDGVRMLQAWTPAGLDIEILLDRAFDIYTLRYRGMPISWLGPSGLKPRYLYEPAGYGWLKTFHGGLLTTCGLEHIGGPKQASNEHNAPPATPVVEYGEHGRISHESADLLTREVQTGPEGVIRLVGLVRQGALYSEQLLLKRTMEISLYKPEISIVDEVTNIGALPARHALLYHVNLGYPLAAEGSVIEASGQAGPRNQAIGPNAPDAAEVVEEWDISPNSDGMSSISLRNPAGDSLRCDYSAQTLPSFLLWTLQRVKSNVVGFAPTTGKGGEDFLLPDESRTYRLRFSLQPGNEG